MNKKLCFILPLICYLSFAAAQPGHGLTGVVIDEEANKVDLAFVSLSGIKDTAFTRGTFTDEDGSFSLLQIPAGTYILDIALIGFENFSTEIVLDGNEFTKELGRLTLKKAAQSLDLITISTKRPYIERKVDRLIIHPDVLLSNTGSNALEALERAPGISADHNGIISLKGRTGVAVYVDDKPTYLSGNDLENYIKSIPVSSILQIEIMVTPPARYEAAGNSGVINIVTKKNRNAGFHGNVVAGIQQGRYTRNNNSLLLSFNHKKWALHANLNGGFRESFQDLNINRYTKNEVGDRISSFSQNSFIVKDGLSFNSKISLDYYFNDKITAGFSVKGLVNPNGDHTDNTSIVQNDLSVIINRVVADNRTKNSFENTAYSVYFKFLPDAGGSALTLDADLVRYSTDSDQKFNNFVFNTDNQLVYQDEIRGAIPSDIHILAVKTDYTRPITSKSKFEAGLKTAYTKTDNEAVYTNTIGGVTLPDYGLSNRFLYDEWIQAGYLNHVMKTGNFDIQLGLRGEFTTLKGEQKGNPEIPDTQFVRQYFDLFPTVFVAWTLDTAGLHGLNFSYGRRIDRPFFQDLNPFISPLDKFTFYGGNPALLPTYSNNFSIAHSYKNLIHTTLNYSKTTDGINETLEIKEGIYYSRPGNIATNHAFSLSVDAAWDVNRWYRVNGQAETGYLMYKSIIYSQNLNNQGTYYRFSLTQGFQLGNGWYADLRGDYQSDIVYAQLRIKSFGTLHAGIQKKILKDRGSIKIGLNDILYTRRADGIIYNLRNTDADWNSRLDTRSVSFAFSYRFGKSDPSKPRHNSTGSESEQNRVKS